MELSTELVTIEPGGILDFASGIGTGHPGRIKAGTYSDPVISGGAGETFAEIWARCTGVGHVYGLRINVQATGLATSSNAGRFELDLIPATAGMPSGGAGLHAAAELGATATGVVGILAGLNASIIAAAASRTLSGAFCAIALQTELKAGNVMGQYCSFIWLNDAGTVDADFFCDCTLLVTGAAHAYVAGLHAGTTVGAVLRFYTPAGVMYAKLYSD